MPSDIKLQESSVDVIGRLDLKQSEDDPVLIRLTPGSGNIRLGGEGADGDLRIEDHQGELRIELDAAGTRSASPDTTRIYVQGAEARLTAGGAAKDGEIILRDSGGRERIRLLGGTTRIESAPMRRTAQPRIVITVDKTIAEEVAEALGRSPRGGRPGIIRMDDTDLEPGGIEAMDFTDISDAATFDIDLVETIIDLRKQVAALQDQIDRLSDG